MDTVNHFLLYHTCVCLRPLLIVEITNNNVGRFKHDQGGMLPTNLKSADVCFRKRRADTSISKSSTLRDCPFLHISGCFIFQGVTFYYFLYQKPLLPQICTWLLFFHLKKHHMLHFYSLPNLSFPCSPGGRAF